MVEFVDPGPHNSLDLHGHRTSNWAIATDSANGVFAYDWSNRSQPRFVDMRPISDPHSVAVFGDTCYVGFPDLRGFRLEPDRGLREVHHLEPPGSVALSDSLLFVARRDGPDLSIYDRLVPGGPKLLATVDDPEHWHGSPMVADGATLYIYVSSWPIVGVWIYDLSDPATPVKIGEFTTTDRAESMALEPDRGLLAIGERDRVELWDVQIPAQPLWQAAIEVPPICRKVDICGDLMLVSTRPALLVDVSDPAEPIPVAEMSPDNPHAWYSSGLVRDQFAAVSVVGPGFTGFDISTPEQPDSIWSRERSSALYGVAVCATLLISSNVGGNDQHPLHLRINGRSDPRRHHALSILPLSASPTGLIARDRVAYVAPRLWTVDLSDPRAPVVTDSLWQPLDSSWELVAELPGGFATISHQSELAICSTADPLHPTVRSRTLVSDFDPDWEMVTAELYGRWEVILRGSYELFRYDVTDPDFPVLIEHDTENFSGADKIAIDGTRLYVSYYWDHFKAFELRESGVALLDALPHELFGTDAMAARDGRIYVLERVSEPSDDWSRLSLYTYSPGDGPCWLDQSWALGSGTGEILAPPGQRVIAPLSGGLHIYRDLGARARTLDPMLPAPEVELPGRVEPVPFVENRRAGP